MYGAKCDKCSLGFSRSDFVMRAKNKIYHIECFRCTACQRQLVPGDEFALRDDGLFCKDDHEVTNNNNTSSNGSSSVTSLLLMDAKSESNGSSGAPSAVNSATAAAAGHKSSNHNNNSLSVNHNISNSSMVGCSADGRHSRANSNDSHSGKFPVSDATRTAAPLSPKPKS